jgi:hypothetical protein
MEVPAFTFPAQTYVGWSADWPRLTVTHAAVGCTTGGQTRIELHGTLGERRVFIADYEDGDVFDAATREPLDPTELARELGIAEDDEENFVSVMDDIRVEFESALDVATAGYVARARSAACEWLTRALTEAAAPAAHTEE